MSLHSAAPLFPAAGAQAAAWTKTSRRVFANRPPVPRSSGSASATRAGSRTLPGVLGAGPWKKPRGPCLHSIVSLQAPFPGAQAGGETCAIESKCLRLPRACSHGWKAPKSAGIPETRRADRGHTVCDLCRSCWTARAGLSRQCGDSPSPPPRPL